MRVKMVVAYDGTLYHGWQLQQNAITIEGILNHALTDLLGEPITVIGASRTDAGVHSLGNVAVFDTITKIPAQKLSYALNQRMPQDIVIQSSEQVPEDFHPRHCNSVKTYEYRILNKEFPDPTRRINSYFYHHPLNIQKMQEAASYLVGEHDFKSFCSIHTKVESTIRTIYSLNVESCQNIITIRISGSGFLYNMVRIIAGTLLEAGSGKRSPESVADSLYALDREKAGPTAPAHGLTMIGIQYDLIDSIPWGLFPAD
ncbi:MAG: tRNA pseudouridine(38-40) synthase TruA [Lachnospiraceae bacterium]